MRLPSTVITTVITNLWQRYNRVVLVVSGVFSVLVVGLLIVKFFELFV